MPSKITDRSYEMCGKQKETKIKFFLTKNSTGQVADLLPTLNNFVWQEKE